VWHLNTKKCCQSISHLQAALIHHKVYRLVLECTMNSLKQVACWELNGKITNKSPFIYTKRPAQSVERVFSLLLVLNQNSHFRVIFTKFFRSIPFTFFENPIKVRQVIKTTFVTYFGNSFTGIYQITGSNPQT